MQITTPTNWDYKILEIIKKINQDKNTKTKIKEVYSGLKTSIAGTARTSKLIPTEINQQYAENYIKQTHNTGIDFNYLINSSNLGNNEYNKKYRLELVDYLKWIESTKADYITIANPFLIDLSLKYTELKVVLSCVTDPKSTNRLNLIKNDNIDRVVFSTTLNRNINLLKKIVNSTDIKTEILANESCLFDCPYRAYHYAVSSFDSQNNPNPNTFDYCLAKCSLAKLKDLTQIIKSPWIRPEDEKIYSDIGIDYLKLSGRIMPTNWITNCIKAYARNKYAGNLSDLIDQQKMYSDDFSELSNNEDFNQIDILIDNNKLNGFLEKIIKSGVDCGQDCENCLICKNATKKAVFIKNEAKKNHLKNIRIILDKGMKVE